MATLETQCTLERMLLHREIEDFLTYEAALLDERRWEEWIDLLTDDVRYYMPIVKNVKYGEHAQRELTREGQEMNWFDEGKAMLVQRVRQMRRNRSSEMGVIARRISESPAIPRS